MPCDLCDGIRGVKVRGIMHIMSILDTFIYGHIYSTDFLLARFRLHSPGTMSVVLQIILHHIQQIVRFQCTCYSYEE